MNDRISAKDNFAARLNRGGTQGDDLRVRGSFTATLRDKKGRVKWCERFSNTVTTAGKNDMLNKYLAGATYTQTLRMGLKGAGTVAAGDTQASHAGWSELGGANAPAYSGNRPSVTMGAASAGSSVSSNVVFTFTSGGTVFGAFINNGGSATKDDTSGTLYAAGDFTGGSKTVANGDSLTINYSSTLN